MSANKTQLKISWNTAQCAFYPIFFPHLDDECSLYVFINRIHPFTHKEATNPTMAKPSLLLHFFILFFFFMILPCLSCPGYQKQALLQFKSSTLSIYSTLHALDSWEFSSSCCLWDGVICSSPPNSTSRAVIALHLSDLFVGSLLENLELFPSSILAPLFFIRSLVVLDISTSSIYGQIPELGFGNLSKLVYLDMRWNRFNGPNGPILSFFTYQISGISISVIIHSMVA